MNNDDKMELAPVEGEMALDITPQFDGEADPTFRPVLALDTGAGDTPYPGQFVLNGIASKTLHIVMIACRETRSLHAKTYKEDSEAPVVCASWDGLDAFGSGCMGEVSDMNFESRQCAADEGGKRVRICEAGKQFICRPNNEFLIMALMPDSEMWIPAFFKMRGVNVKPSSAAWQSVKMKEIASIKTADDGSKRGIPKYLYALEITAKKNPAGKAGYTTIFSSPEFVMTDGERTQILDFVREHSQRMWQEETDSLREMAEAITGEKREHE